VTGGKLDWLEGLWKKKEIILVICFPYNINKSKIFTI